MDTVLAARRRRRALAKKIGDGIIVLAAAAPAPRSRDTFYAPYRHSSHFFYLTGCREPHTALLMAVESGRIAQEHFFCRPPDAAAARWEGAHLTPARARRQLDIADCFALGKLPAHLVAAAARHDTVFCLPGSDAALDCQISALMQQRPARSGSVRLASCADVSVFLDEMRLIKDRSEIARLRAAARLTVRAMAAARQAARTARREQEVEAALIATYRAHGAQHAFAPIVASGRNACILHYTRNSAPLQKGKPLLIDTGGELDGYAADISRTFAPDGAPSGAFADLHAIVLAAQQRAIAAARPGATWQTLEDAAARELAAGLRRLKLCRASVDGILKKQLHKRFYPHRIGHFLGLDVHDVGSSSDAHGKPRRLRPGMVLTVEPGLYIPPAADIPRAFAGLGVRIEDDILITARGCENLTAAASHAA